MQCILHKFDSIFCGTASSNVIAQTCGLDGKCVSLSQSWSIKQANIKQRKRISGIELQKFTANWQEDW